MPQAKVSSDISQDDRFSDLDDEEPSNDSASKTSEEPEKEEVAKSPSATIQLNQLGLHQIIDSNPNWKSQGLCVTVYPELFYPGRGDSIKETKAICEQCPVRWECLVNALYSGEKFGVWGGLSERERRKLRRILRNNSQQEAVDFWLEHKKLQPKLSVPKQLLCGYSGNLSTASAHKVASRQRAKKPFSKQTLDQQIVRATRATFEHSIAEANRRQNAVRLLDDVEVGLPVEVLDRPPWERWSIDAQITRLPTQFEAEFLRWLMRKHDGRYDATRSVWSDLKNTFGFKTPSSLRARVEPMLELGWLTKVNRNTRVVNQITITPLGQRVSEMLSQQESEGKYQRIGSNSQSDWKTLRRITATIEKCPIKCRFGNAFGKLAQLVNLEEPILIDYIRQLVALEIVELRTNGPKCLQISIRGPSL